MWSERTLMCLGLGLALGASACTVVEGNGIAAQEERPVRSFDELEIRGDVVVIARVDPTLEEAAGFSLRVAGDENLLPHVKTRIVGQRLIVDTSEVWLSPQLPLEVTVRASELRALEVYGAQVRAEGMDQRSMRVIAEGGAVWLRGRVDQARLVASNGAEVDALELVTWSARVDAGQSAEISVCAEDMLEVVASDYARVTYSCRPYEVYEDLSGGASLTRAW